MTQSILLIISRRRMPILCNDLSYSGDPIISTHYIPQAYADPMQRLELRWRPNHIYSKPACGDRHSVTNLLLRVRRRKKRHQSPHVDPGADVNKDMPDSDPYEYEGCILGVIDTVYKFQCMFVFGNYGWKCYVR